MKEEQAQIESKKIIIGFMLLGCIFVSLIYLTYDDHHNTTESQHNQTETKENTTKNISNQQKANETFEIIKQENLSHTQKKELNLQTKERLISYCSGVLHDSDEENVVLYSYGNISNFSWNYFLYVSKDLGAAEEAMLGGIIDKIIPIDFKEENESLTLYAIKPFLYDEAVCGSIEEVCHDNIFVLNIEKKIKEIEMKYIDVVYNPYPKIIHAGEKDTYLIKFNKTPYKYYYGFCDDFDFANETLHNNRDNVISSSTLLNKRNKFYERCFNVSYKENETYGNAILPARYMEYVDSYQVPQDCGTHSNKFLLSWKFYKGELKNLCKNKTLYLKIKAGNNAKAIISNAYFVYNVYNNTNMKGLRIFPFVVPCKYFDEKCDLTKNYTLEINFSEDIDFVEIIGVKLCKDCGDKDKIIYERMDCKKNSENQK